MAHHRDSPGVVMLAPVGVALVVVDDQRAVQQQDAGRGEEAVEVAPLEQQADQAEAEQHTDRREHDRDDADHVVLQVPPTVPGEHRADGHVDAVEDGEADAHDPGDRRDLVGPTRTRGGTTTIQSVKRATRSRVFWVRSRYWSSRRSRAPSRRVRRARSTFRQAVLHRSSVAPWSAPGTDPGAAGRPGLERGHGLRLGTFIFAALAVLLIVAFVKVKRRDRRTSKASSARWPTSGATSSRRTRRDGPGRARSGRAHQDRSYVGLLVLGAIVGLPVALAAYFFLKSCPTSSSTCSRPCRRTSVQRRAGLVAAAAAGARRAARRPDHRYLPGTAGTSRPTGSSRQGQRAADRLPGIFLAPPSPPRPGRGARTGSAADRHRQRLGVLAVHLVKRDAPEMASGSSARPAASPPSARCFGSPIAGRSC